MIETISSRPELLWFVIGLGMFLLELVVPGFFIFFFGLGAWVTALVCLVANPGINVQIIIFAITSVLSLVALRNVIQKKYFNRKAHLSDEVEDEFTGKEGHATTDFGGEVYGKVEFRGTTWKAESKSDIKEGQTVIVQKKENFTLTVKPKN